MGASLFRLLCVNYDTLIKKCPIVTHTQQQLRQVNTIPFVYIVLVAAS